MDNTLDKALDLLGLYNSIAILMTGLISEAVFCIELYIYRCIGVFSSAAKELIIAWGQTWFWVAAILFGYLLGMLLNSWGGFFHYVLKKVRCWDSEKYSDQSSKYGDFVKERAATLSSYEFKDFRNIILWNILVGKNNPIFRGCSITTEELKQVLEANKNNSLNDDEKETISDLYLKCKHKLSPQLERYALQQQSIAAMCRSLGFFFIVLSLFSIILIINLLLQNTSIPFRVLIVSMFNLLTAITMWLRNERFIRLRYITILRAGMKKTTTE